MHIGHYISGAAHVGVIGWVMFGGVFRSDPPPFEVTGVSVITSEQFNALNAVQRAPGPETEVDVPVAPELREDVPEVPSQVDREVPTDAPDNAQVPEPDVTPDLSDLQTPQPSDVTDDAPDIEAPAEEMAVLIPRDEVRPVLRPADRVAPEPVAPPEPDVRIDDALREATVPDEQPGEAVEEPQDATAPEAATTEIVTEAKDQVALAPKRSLRPVLRTRSQPKPSVSAGADAAVAAALAEDTTPAVPSGPPLSQGEKDALRVSVQKCWVVDVGSQSANVTVTVGLSMTREGKVDGAIKLLSSEGGDERATKTAYEAARRAILRCQKGGYNLPIEKYDHWRDIEITFNPEKMRLK